mmetsp:Transcript_89441/g.230883  ORF Transcript_89441/g.230883 Transcript_89441/m.230883 type:complete len:415 (-) Transcript_89441:124-1368(-)
MAQARRGVGPRPGRGSGRGQRRLAGKAVLALVGAASTGILACDSVMPAATGVSSARWPVVGGLPSRPTPRARGLTARPWSLFGWGDNSEPEPELDERHRNRFLSYAEGEGSDARLQREGMRSLLECTDSFCLSKHWLDQSFVDEIYNAYVDEEDGISIWGFNKMEHDGLLLEGALEDYEKAFSAVDVLGEGLISRSELGQLFAGMGQVMSPEELDKIVDEADVGHDGIDLADFLGLARTHLDLREVLAYATTRTEPNAPLPVDLADKEFAPDAGLAEVTTVHGEAELNAIIANEADTVVELAFTWCRPCKAFWPKYQKYAKVYRNTRFLKIVGNENESCKHYARDVLQAKISPMFATYAKGKLVTTWNGANTGRFIENIEASLETAASLASEREAAVAADETIAPSALRKAGTV